MPIIFEYKGILLLFYSNDHYPIHVHAFTQHRAIKVEFYLQGDEVRHVVYKGVRGYKKFKPAEMKLLKRLINKYKYEIVEDWFTFFFKNERVKRKIIHSL